MGCTPIAVTRKKSSLVFPPLDDIISSTAQHRRNDFEFSEIHQEAFPSILDGEDISSVQFWYNRRMDAYLQAHLWDDLFMEQKPIKPYKQLKQKQKAKISDYMYLETQAFWQTNQRMPLTEPE